MMKPRQQTLFGIFIGLIISGVILLVVNPPGKSEMILLPTRKVDLVTVYISGEVKNLGIYSLPSGSRVNDAKLKAGGFTLQANSEAVNLATKLEDEDRISIPAMNSEGSPTSESNQKGLININTASVEVLDQLPRVGQVKAQTIVDFRTNNGPFLSIDDIMNVPGIGLELFNLIKDQITINP
jgi:competence protein ComEA